MLTFFLIALSRYFLSTKNTTDELMWILIDFSFTNAFLWVCRGYYNTHTHTIGRTPPPISE